MVKVYHYATSHCSREVQLVVAELDIPHELIRVHITMCQNYAPDYVWLNPGMAVPTFVDMDSTVGLDSKVIIEYVVKNYTEKYNRDPVWDFWMFDKDFQYDTMDKGAH
jgi:glutathione S-transferase